MNNNGQGIKNVADVQRLSLPNRSLHTAHHGRLYRGGKGELPPCPCPAPTLLSPSRQHKNIAVLFSAVLPFAIVNVGL